MPVHANFLSRTPLLAELPAELRERLAAKMSLVSLPRRGMALEKGKSGQGLGFVLEGQLQGLDFTLDGREVGLYFIAPGGYCGELSVVDGQAAPEYAVALVKTELLRLPEAAARELLLPAPGVAEAFARRLAARVRAGIAQRSLLALANPMQRLAAQLVALTGDDSKIAHAPTHQEIAIMINTTRETVSRNFQVLLTQGVLERDGDRLVVRRMEMLQGMVEGKRE